MRACWLAFLLPLAVPAGAQSPPLPAPAEPVAATFSLTSQFEEQLATQEWTLVKGGPEPFWAPLAETPPFPVRAFLSDAASGARSAMKPAAYFTTEGRHRWGGRTLGVDWVLVLDGVSNQHLRASLQFKSTTARVLTAEVGLGLDLAGWTWHDGPRHAVALGPGAGRVDNAESSTLGAGGRRARLPVSVIGQAGRALVLEAGRPEPGAFHFASDYPRGWWGLLMDFALDPRTQRFPGRAAWTFELHATTNHGAAAFRAAWQEARGRAEPARTWAEDQPLRYDDEAFAATPWPPVYRRDELRPGLATARPFDLGQTVPLDDLPAGQEDRLRQAGWLPFGTWRAEGHDVTLEEFGAPTSTVRHAVIRSISAWAQVAHLEIPDLNETALLVDPASGDVVYLQPGAHRAAVWLEPGQAATRDVFASAALEEARRHYQGDVPATPDHLGLAANLDSLARLRALEVELAVRSGTPLTAGSDQPITVALANRGQTPLIVHELLLEGTTAPQALLLQPLVVEPDATAELTGYLDPATLQPPACRFDLRLRVERGGTGVEVTWGQRLPVVETLWAHLPTGRVVTVDDTVTLPLHLWNRGETPLAFHLANRGEFGGEDLQDTLSPGEQRSLAWTLRADEPQNGLARLQVLAGDRPVLARDISVEFLPPEASLARDRRVRLETSPGAPGADPEALRDGDRATAWTSAADHATPWVRMIFPEPTTVSEVTLVWPDGQAAQGGRLYGITAAGEELELARFRHTNRTEELRVEFGMAHVQSIELRQAPGEGPPDRPNVLGLNELEVR